MKAHAGATVTGLYLRPGAGQAPQAHRVVDACAGAGLRGDVQAHPLSPRQLLITGQPAYTRLELAPNALRENLLLDIDSADLRSGQLLAVGNHAVLRLMFRCEPCARLEPHRRGLTRAVGAQRGMLARVHAGGTLRTGDPVRILPLLAPAWSDDWRARVAAVLLRVPDGMVLDYRQLALLAGVATSYCRVFPRLAERLGQQAKAVPLRSTTAAPRWDGAGLFDDLLTPA